MATTAVLVVVLPACSSPGPGPEGPEPQRRQPFSRPLEIYRDLGFMTGPGQFPAVASFATMAGPADSAYVLLAMSLPTAALRFQREGDGFFAEYRLDITFMDTDSVAVKRFEAREVVRVSSFAETGRTDESIIYQQGITIPPGHYIVRLQAADANSSRGFRMTDTLTVPDYRIGPGLASPVLVYDAGGRARRESLPALITNPRHTVPFGSEAPLVYIESYDTARSDVTVRVLDEAGTEVWSGHTTLSVGAEDLRYALIEIPVNVLPLGRFWVEVGNAGTPPVRTPLVMTISDEWMIANVGELTGFLRYIAYEEELDSLRTGSPIEQRAAWERFWARRDPLPVTEINEYRDQFFQRVRYATEAFREGGNRPGWETDRGEVFIVLGPPDQVIERYIGERNVTLQPNGEEWVYTAVPGGELALLFYDRSGFGRFELIPSSATSFHNVAERLKPKRQGN
ncbi:MAG TPA: GWxTD domain-containing protein [Longimicrobiales bacterium]